MCFYEIYSDKVCVLSQILSLNLAFWRNMVALNARGVLFAQIELIMIKMEKGGAAGAPCGPMICYPSEAAL